MAAVLIPEIQQLVTRYLQEIGLNADTCFNKERCAWYWSRGSANIEVFVESIDLSSGAKRHYLRVFSPLVKVPPAAGTAFYRRLLELNDKSLGVKLTLLPSKDTIYATFERDIKGMDYDELADTIADLEWWADNLDDKLMQEFGAIK
ncbi:MAG TPA: YbjN domain-containing protein [Ignavibacteria bacterium]|nr:YbjN domain-containing protein [Ignavibacteria bacterium]